MLLAAAGIQEPSPIKIDNSIFDRSILKQIESYEPRPVKERRPWPKIAVISDIHWPFCNERVVKAFQAFCEEHQPSLIVLNGDAWDMYSHTKFPRSHNVFTPREERDLALKMNRDFWVELKRTCPKARFVQMLGNHDVRPLKRVLEDYPAAEDWIREAIERDFTFEGVETFFDARQELLVEDIAIFHGYRSKLGDHRDYTHLNAVVGHTHKGGAVFRQIKGQVLWELNSGFAGDPESKGLSYTPQRIIEWTPGFAFIDSYGPRFIPV